jgi:hypothetical protein
METLEKVKATYVKKVLKETLGFALWFLVNALARDFPD